MAGSSSTTRTAAMNENLRCAERIGRTAIESGTGLDAMAELSAPPTPAPARRRVTAGLAVLAWCAAVAVAATGAWLVVDRAGSSLLGSTGPGLSAAGAG